MADQLRLHGLPAEAEMLSEGTSARRAFSQWIGGVTRLAISSEAIVMGVRAGLDPSVMCDVINAGSGRNSATQDKFPRCIIPRSFDYGFASGLMFKDIGLFMSEAEAMGLELGTAGAVRDLWKRVVNELGGQSDFTEIVKVLEGPADVVVKARP